MHDCRDGVEIEGKIGAGKLKFVDHDAGSFRARHVGAKQFGIC